MPGFQTNALVVTPISGDNYTYPTQFVRNINYTVKNSCEFSDFIRDKTLNACEELVSFDVVSLFTKDLS